MADATSLRITEEDAEEYTQALGQVMAGGYRQIVLASRLGVPQALGMSTREWVNARLGGYIRYSIEERREAVAELAEEGYTQREVADALGVSHTTVGRDLNGEEEDVGTNVPDEPESVPEVGHDSGDVGTNVPNPEVTDLDPQASTLEDDSDDEPEPTPTLNEGDEWYTPKWLFDALGVTFAIDVCSPPDLTHVNVPAEEHYTVEDDGLAQTWHGTVWCNPPYSKPEPWARRMIHHGDGLLLVHMPMNAGWCVDVWQSCDAIRLFQAMEFVRPDGSTQRPGYWLQLAAFGETSVAALARLQPLGDAARNQRRVASPMWKAAA